VGGNTIFMARFTNLSGGRPSDWVNRTLASVANSRSRRWFGEAELRCAVVMLRDWFADPLFAGQPREPTSLDFGLTQRVACGAACPSGQPIHPASRFAAELAGTGRREQW
jgi:hypothetical protein